MPLVGGLGEVKPADDTVHGIVKTIEQELRIKITEKYPSVSTSEFSPVAVAYKSQIVAGTNYFIKIKISDGGNYIHARIYRDLTGNVTVHSVSDNKTETDEIIFF